MFYEWILDRTIGRDWISDNIVRRTSVANDGINHLYDFSQLLYPSFSDCFVDNLSLHGSMKPMSSLSCRGPRIDKEPSWLLARPPVTLYKICRDAID